MRLSNQALGAIMLALQNSLLTQTDIVPVLKEFQLQFNENEELIILNPPVVKENSLDNNTWSETKGTVGSD